MSKASVGVFFFSSNIVRWFSQDVDLCNSFPWNVDLIIRMDFLHTFDMLMQEYTLNKESEPFFLDMKFNFTFSYAINKKNAKSKKWQLYLLFKIFELRLKCP